jgi:hypothetical protein
LKKDIDSLIDAPSVRNLQMLLKKQDLFKEKQGENGERGLIDQI